jgi:hypothetical protein
MTGPVEKTVTKEWNLLDRLLGLKPEAKVLVLCHPRKSARSILSRILLAEHGSGITDLKRDVEARNSFTGRLDKDNS